MGTNGTTISGGDVNVSGNKITGLKDGAADTDAATVGQMKTAIGDAKTKYYSVNDKNSISPTQKTLPTMPGLADNSDNNKGAKGMGSLASGFSTEADGIASTVAGSYSGVINQNGNVLDLRGATALSYGTFNINQNIDTQKAYSGVANSIVGQANMTTDSNAAIIYGAGNTITNSYRDIDISKFDLSKVEQDIAKKDAAAVAKDLQEAVSTSGGQVMVMGGGNSVDNAYMTQIIGVGNNVNGTNTNKNKEIASEYDSSASTQYNYVDGFQNTLTNGKNDYIIGANNSVTGDSIDKNQSNIVVGDNHTLTNKNNNVVIGSADTPKELTASNAVVIGHNADVKVDNGVALGSESEASVAAGVAGYAPVASVTNKNTATWKSTNAAVSVGKADGSITRQITGVAAGTADTDAVNVAQIKELANIDASNIGTNLKGSAATTDEQNTNENAWGKAIGTGKIADPDASDKETNGSQQLVTGGTVYKALNGGMTKIVIGTPGENGKDGAPGTIGLVGPAGANGKNAEVDITIQQGEDDASKGVKGANGVDGQDGITRIVYKDAAGDHQVATMEDGLKFAGDDGQTSADADKVIAKKLNNTIDIIGGADRNNLTGNNIGVNNVDGKLKVQLVKDLTGITSISGSTDDKGAKITLDTTDTNISVNGGSIKDVASNLDRDGQIISGNENNAANMSDVQTLVQQGVDNGYTNGNGITIQKDGTSNVISVNKGDGLTFDNGKLAVNTGDGLTVDETTKALKIKTSDSNLKVDQNGIGLNNVITIGTAGTAGTNAHPITIDGTKGEVSGLNNTSWDSTADYSESTKAATESQVAAAVKDAIKQAGDNDTHVAAGSYAVNDQNQVSMNLVDKNNDTKGTVIITDVAKSSEMGDVSKLADGVKNAGGKTTTVVDAINNVNTSMNTKIGDQNYSTSNTSGSNKYVQDGDSITRAIGKLDGAVQQAASAAGKHSTVSEGSNIKVNGNVQNDGHTDYKVSLKDDISLNSVTTKSATTDTLTVNNSATIGGVTIENKTISGLDDTEIEKDSKKAVNAGTIYNELRPTNNGSYIQTTNTTAQNLVSLDTQVKKTSDLINSDGKTIKIGGSDAATKVDVSGKDSSGHSTSRVITGVKTDANDSTSAASVGYVNDMNAANTQQIYHDMNSAYSHVENDISRAAAGSNALAALHPMEFDPDDKAQYALGYGHYRNSNAGAVGVFYQPDENSLFSLGASFGNGDAGINAGVTVKFGPGGSGHHALTKTQMAKVIDAQSKEIDALKKDNADKDKRIDALEQKVNEILAKVEKDKA